MAENPVHRIYTEDKNKREIIKLVAVKFESFTLQPTTGYFRGKGERSILIEIVGAAKRDIRDLAARIAEMNGQKSVLVLSFRGQAHTIRR